MTEKTVRKLGRDTIVVNGLNIPAKLLCAMNGWKESTHNTFEALYVLTDGGQYGIEITVASLAEFARVSVARVYESIDFLEKEGFVIREKSFGGRKANKYFLSDIQEQFFGDLVVQSI